MNRILLIIALTFNFLPASAQVLSSIDFTTYNYQALGADLTGTASNQQGWLSFATATSYSFVNDFRITDSGNPGKKIDMYGFDHETIPGTKFLWKSGFPALWNSRTPGNNTIEFQIDYFAPNSTLSSDKIQVMILDTSLSKILAGFTIYELGPISARLYNYSETDGFGNWNYELGTSTTLFPLGSWMKLILRFNKDTGEATFIIKNPNGTIFRQKSITGFGAGLDPGEIDFVISADTSGYSYPARVGFDNYKITALSSALSIDEVVEPNSGFSIYPNPATTEISISNKNLTGISSIVFTDINGRTVKQNIFDNLPNVQMNIAELSSGIYLMKITSEEGTFTKKIIKN